MLVDGVHRGPLARMFALKEGSAQTLGFWLMLVVDLVLFALAGVLLLLRWGVRWADIAGGLNALLYGFKLGGMTLSLLDVLIAAALGLLVGIVVVAQTIYASTMDHIREYGTLKAMGASNGYLYRVIIKQAAISGLIGYVIGMSMSLFVSRASMQGTTAIILPPLIIAALLVLTLLMCIGASLVSINKVTRLDPAMVFRG